jgi:hypothetical protein
MRSTIRDAALAIVATVAITIAVDLLLQFLTASMRLTGGIRPPWWARAAAESVWIVAGIILWMAAPLIATALEEFVPDARVSRRVTWALVGTALIVVPPVWIVAELMVLAIQLTLSGTWGSEARIFVSGAYYGTVLLTLTPWVAAGVILRAWAAHLID